MHERERGRSTGVTIPPSLREPLAVSASDFCPFLLPSQLDASKCETCLTLSRRSFPLPLYSTTHTNTQRVHTNTGTHLKHTLILHVCMRAHTVSSLPSNLSFPFLSPAGFRPRLSAVHDVSLTEVQLNK